VAAALKQELHANRFEKGAGPGPADLCATASTPPHRLSQVLPLSLTPGRLRGHRYNADRPAWPGRSPARPSWPPWRWRWPRGAGRWLRQGRTHLESLFLDEGFGDADADTRRRCSVEDLGGRPDGRPRQPVPELAERVPVRPRSAGARGGRVERGFAVRRGLEYGLNAGAMARQRSRSTWPSSGRSPTGRRSRRRPDRSSRRSWSSWTACAGWRPGCG
jgi:hypothetical protein